MSSLDNSQHTPMDYACYYGQEACVSVLLDDDVTYKNPKSSCFGPLHCAAFKGHSKCIETLFEEIEDGDLPDINAHDEANRTPLHLAALSGSFDTVDVLLVNGKENGLEINAKDVEGNTPLMLAALEGNFDICVKFVQNDADVGCTNNTGDSCSHLAFANDGKESGASLIEAIVTHLSSCVESNVPESGNKEKTKLEAYLACTDERGRTYVCQVTVSCIYAVSLYLSIKYVYIYILCILYILYILSALVYIYIYS